MAVDLLAVDGCESVLHCDVASVLGVWCVRSVLPFFSTHFGGPDEDTVSNTPWSKNRSPLYKSALKEKKR